MRFLNQGRKKLYNRQPNNSTCHVDLFVRMTGIDMAGLLRNWKLNTLRVIKTTLKTWSSHTSCLVNTSNGSQGKLPHQRMEFNFSEGNKKEQQSK